MIFGHFKTRKSYCSNCKTYTESHEEKQTDVNIAMQILEDSYEQTHDMVQIISGDTDLVPPIKFARNKGKIINVVLPPYKKANELIQNSDKKSNIKIRHLQQSFLGNSYTFSKKETSIQCPYSYP